MIVTCVHVYVKPECVESFISATILNHQASIKEPGNLRFDVLQLESDGTEFMLYEAFKTEEDRLAHRDTAHYKEWKNAVETMMVKPREGIRYHVIAPEAGALW